MKKTFSILLTLALVLSFSVVAVPVGVVGGSTSTINVSQPVQVTSDGHYERGQSIVYDGSDYWLFYGRSVSVTGTYGSGNPDTHDYKIYYKKASTVAGLASATATLLVSTNNANIYLGETDAAYYDGKMLVYAAVDVGSTCTLYQFWTNDGGSSWTENAIVTGMPDGAAHFAVTSGDGKLWFAYQEGNDWNSKYWDGSWHGPYDITDNYGTAKFYVEGTNLYFVRADSGDQDIHEWNGSSWSQIDSASESGPYDPTIYKIGSNYVCAYAPLDGTKQYIKAKVNTDLNHLLDLTGGSEVAITFGGYSTSNTWVDMWPTGFTDQNGDTYLFYTSERNPSDTSSEIAGNIWYLEVDWPVTNDHYTYIQNAIDAASSTTIYVAPGTYPAGIKIDKPLNIIGSGSSLTFLTGGILIAGTSSWSGLLLQDMYLKGDYSGNAKDAVIDLDGAPVVSDFTIKGCVLDGEGDSDRKAFYGDNVMSGDWTWEGNEIKAFREWFLIDNTHSVAPSGVTNALGDVVFKNNWIHDCYGSIAFRGKPSQKTSSVVVSGNTFEDYPSHALSQAWAAIEVNIATSLVMYDNNIDGIPEVSWGGEGQALQIWGIDTIDIYCNNFTNCYQGIWVFGGSADGTYGGPYAIPSGAIYNNNIVGTSDYGIAVENTATGGPLNAENNWWGDTDGSGPYDPQDETDETTDVPPCSVSVAAMMNPDGAGDEVYGLVDYCPWLNYSAETTTGAGNASFTCSHGCVNNLTAVPTPPNQPVYLPYGVFSFNISCIDPGETVTVTVTLPGPVPVGSVWWKYQNGSWYSVPIGSDDGDNVITITLTDGGQGDEDGIANGQIIDDGGPGPLSRGLIVRSTEGGRVTKPGDGNHLYERGTVVKLVATPDDGYKFAEWTGDVRRIDDVNAASTTITMDYSYVVIANFVTVETTTVETEVQYELNVSSTMGGSVASPGEGTFPYIEGTVVSLAASPDDGYKFVNWTGDGITNADSTTTSVTMNGDYSVTANFEFEQTGGTDSGGESSVPIPTGCFIATAAYGTSTAEQIDVLREFRDVVLLESSVGSQFVDLYYKLSPPVADFIAGNSFLRAMVRELMGPVVWVVEATGDIWRN